MQRVDFCPKRALILTKVTRLEFERRLHPGLSDSEIDYELSRRGSNYKRLFNSHNEHKAYLKVMEQELSDAKIEVRVVDRFHCDTAAIDWSDVVFTAGGDGTFLHAASQVRNNEKPVIGINTDPNGSEGYLCLYRSLKSDHFKSALHQLLKGEFNWLYRQRIRLKLRGSREYVEHIGTDDVQCVPQGDMVLPRCAHDTSESAAGEEIVVPELALNDVFIGESHSSRVSYFDIQLDDEHEPVKQKNSGITICTGTGSSSWFFNINKLTSQSVSDILKAAAKELHINLPSEDPKFVNRICDDFNGHLTFSPTVQKMAYSFRDPINNSVFRSFPPRGFANRLLIKSRCFDAHVVIDGGVAYKFNDGAEAILEVFPEDTLKTVVIR
uniref:NAD(+) kinase n=1 Tax=Syphacia muris TaxID=451379 RepID=A0A0N5AXS6_9BILA